LARYIVFHLLGMLGVLLVISILTFVVMHAIPGGPFDEGEMPVSAETKAALNAKYGFDRPLHEQYLRYMRSALAGDFGVPFQSPSETVVGLIGRTWKVSLLLGGASMMLSAALGILLGFLGAVRQNTWIDYTTSVVAVLGVVLPPFVVAMILIYVFSLELRLLPTGGWGDSWTQAVLPIVTFSFGITAKIARYTRSSVLEVLRSDFIRTARAKGLSQRAVLQRHVLRNSLSPLVTIAGPLFAGVITGSFFVETIFRIPGIGLYFTRSALERDYPMIMALTLLFATLITIIFFVTDMLYAVIDPRVRLIGGERS